MKTKIHGPLLLIAALLIVVGIGSRSEARAGPKEIPKPNTPTRTPLPPSPTASPTPSKTPEPTATPTPTLPPAIAITANIKVRRCLYYADVMRSWIALRPPEYVKVTEDTLPILLGICAAESGGRSDLVSSAGAVGVMQVIPRPWLGSCLDVPTCNIYWGIWIFDRAWDKYGDVRTALAMYNCSEEKVYADMCGPRGGYHYSDDILEFWIPLFEIALEE